MSQFCHRYFSLQASCPLYFDDTTRVDIENKICDESGPRVDSYDTAQKQAYDRMNEVSLHHLLGPHHMHSHWSELCGRSYSYLPIMMRHLPVGTHGQSPEHLLSEQTWGSLTLAPPIMHVAWLFIAHHCCGSIISSMLKLNNSVGSLKIMLL